MFQSFSVLLSYFQRWLVVYFILLYLLAIDVLIQKYWENGSELTEKHWYFVIYNILTHNSIWLYRDCNMKKYSSNFRKAGLWWFLLYSLLNIRKHLCEIARLDLFKKRCEENVLQFWNSWDKRAPEKSFWRILLLYWHFWFCGLKQERKTKEAIFFSTTSWQPLESKVIKHLMGNTHLLSMTGFLLSSLVRHPWNSLLTAYQL